jgi:hypothetical protein
MGPHAWPVSMSTQRYLEKAQGVTASAIQKQMARCNESLTSTHNMRATLSRKLGVTRTQAHLLVNRVVIQLLENGVLEYWDSGGRGVVYRVNVGRLAGIEPEMT